jgi:tyrosinase
MTLPSEAELLGASSGELEIKDAGATTIVRLRTEAERSIAALIESSASADSARSFYLGLENVRGTFDAAVLNTYINLPENARPVDHRNLLAESVALYGLRMASMQQGANAAQGLTFLLEITQILIDLAAANSLNPEEIRVTIVPDRPLPDSVTLVIGRISIFTTPPS